MENILFFGLEVTFIMFEMLSFLIVDLIVGGNFMLAGIGSATLSLVSPETCQPFFLVIPAFYLIVYFSLLTVGKTRLCSSNTSELGSENTG